MYYFKLYSLKVNCIMHLWTQKLLQSDRHIQYDININNIKTISKLRLACHCCKAALDSY